VGFILGIMDSWRGQGRFKGVLTPTRTPKVLSQEPAGDYRGGVRAAAPAAAGAAEGNAGGAGGGHGADADRHRAEDPALQPAAPQGAGGQPDPPGALGRSRQTRLFSRRRVSF